MRYCEFGRTGLVVSRFCLGTLTLGPLQMRAAPEESRQVIQAALDSGVNFFDTAHIYGTYGIIRNAIGRAPGTVISSRSYAHDARGMRAHLEHALRETGRDHIEIFGLHEQESRLTLKGHGEALSYLCRAKEQGKISAVCVSTHVVEVVREAARIKEVDVIHPLINRAGIGIRGGSAAEMIEAISEAASLGKAVYAMKALAGGHLSADAYRALCFVRDIEGVSAVAVGAGSCEEVRYNAEVLAGGVPSHEIEQSLRLKSRSVQIARWCTGCGACSDACPQDAISILEGRAHVSHNRCVLCGYCAAACREFCIKVLPVSRRST